MEKSADLLDALRIDRTTPPPPRRGWIGMAIGAVALLLALGIWAAFGRHQELEVEIAPVVAITPGTATSVLDASGYVVARRMATVSAKITGKVRQVLIEEGQHVKAGQVLATLDPIDATTQRDLAGAQLLAARSQASAVQAQLREAQANVKRLDGLVDRQLVSRAQYEQAVAQRDALQAQFASAQRSAQVAADQLRIAEHGVDDTVVRAPFDGVVVAKAAQPGEIVSPLSAGGGFTRTGIGTIVDMDSLEVEVDVGEAYIGRVQPRMPVEAVLNAYPDWTIPGEVIAIIPTADRSKATVKVRVALKVSDPRIVPDMGVKVSFLEAPEDTKSAAAQGVRIPVAAVVTRDDEEVAFVLGRDNAVRRRTLKLGRLLDDDRQVLAGLSAGERVVLDPPPELQDGAQVRVASGDAAP